MSLREGIDAYYGSFGVKGLLAISSFRLIGMPKFMTVHPEGIEHPVHLRVRTSDLSLYQSILVDEEYRLDPWLSPKVILDAGANCGLTSIYYASKYPHARIISVEPDEWNYRCLLQNVLRYPNIVPIKAALWNEDGEVALAKVGKDWARQTKPGCGCQALTLPTLMATCGIDSIDILKIDIEGAEMELFSECSWIDRVRVLVIELHDRFRPGCRETVERAMHGWQHFERGELTFFTRPELHSGTRDRVGVA